MLVEQVLCSPLRVSPYVSCPHETTRGKGRDFSSWSVISSCTSYPLPSPSLASSRLLIAVGTVGAGGGLLGVGIVRRAEAEINVRKMFMKWCPVARIIWLHLTIASSGTRVEVL